MGIFFTAAPADAKAVAAASAAGRRQLMWGRVVTAGAVLLVILGAGLYAGTVPALGAWNNALLHAFEVLLGLFVGVVGGEAASRS